MSKQMKYDYMLRLKVMRVFLICNIRVVQKSSRTDKLMAGTSRTSNIESNNSQNGGLEDYNNISDEIFPHFTTPSIKISLG